MSYSFKVLNCSDLFTYEEDGLHIVQSKLVLNLMRDDNKLYTITIYPGAKCDGLSIPVLFRWFLPSWDANNQLYNVAGLVHDLLYGSELLPKDECDDIFRSILRDAGISRFKGSTAEWCVEKFAKSHYGKKHAKYNESNYISIL